MALEESKLEELTVGFYDTGVIKFGDFPWTLKSGRKSPLYFNSRPATSFSSKLDVPRPTQLKIRNLAVDGYSEAIDDLGHDYEHLFGIPQSSTPFASMAAHQRGDSLLWGRVGDKSYGAHSAVEGHYIDEDRVINADDVITNAASKFETVESLGKVMLLSQGFVVMFDREEGGAQAVREGGYDIVNVIGLGKSMAILSDNGRIGQQEYDWVATYHEDLRAHGMMPPASDPTP